MRRMRLACRNSALLAVLLSACILLAALSLRSHLSAHGKRAAPVVPLRQASSPWIYGRVQARFTIVEYADLECPYCREYFPALRRWIDEHPESNWEWQHLPLAIHDPAATQEARLAECVGETGGNSAFWSAVAWIYAHTRGDGAGVPAALQIPGMSDSLRACLASSRPDAAIRAQIEAAARDNITATPTLRLIDRPTGQTLTLSGAVEDDALLSAIDLLVARGHPVNPKTSVLPAKP